MPRAKVFDEWEGIRSGWWKDPSTGTNVVVNKQDCSDILRLTQHSQNGDQAYNRLGHKLLGSVGVVEYYRALSADGIDVRTWFQMPRKERDAWHKRKFNGDWSKLRATAKPL